MNNRTIRQALGGIALAAFTTLAQATAIHDSGLFTNVLGPNDDGSTGAVALGFTANLGGTDFTTAHVNNNGNITFNNALSTFTPAAINTGNFGPIIAPFFADVDTRGANSDVVRYGTSSIGGMNVFGVNWIGVGAFSGLDVFNSFQLILTDRSDVAAGDFDIQFNYDEIVWESGQASGSNNQGLGGISALVGYWVSAGSNATLNGSLVNGAFLDSGPAGTSLIQNSLNSNVLGQYNFQVRNGSVVVNPTIPEPTSVALFALGMAGLGFSRRNKK